MEKIALQAYNQQYVSADLNKGGILVANRNEIKEWETFELIDRGNGIALKAANGQYFSAEGGGGGKVLANRNEISDWETFSITNILPRQLVWSDEFEVIDDSVWSFEVYW